MLPGPSASKRNSQFAIDRRMIVAIKGRAQSPLSSQLPIGTDSGDRSSQSGTAPHSQAAVPIRGVSQMMTALECSLQSILHHPPCLPLCRGCHRTMALFLIEPHEKYKDLDVQHFRCECGATLTDQVPRIEGP